MTDEQTILAWIKSAEMDRSADYLLRGRLHAEVPEKALIERWTAAAKAMCLEPWSEDRRLAESDLKSELELRGLDAPFQDLQVELELFSQRFREATERLRRENPASLARLEAKLAAMIGTFEVGKGASQN